MKNDTIAAIATGMNASGISIIRISGADAIIRADRIFKDKGGRHILKDAKTHTIHYGYITDQKNDTVLDEVLVSVMRAPKSYTSEDVVEINCHGGIYVTKKILDTVLSLGVRLAEPGEFTKRAFLNGRMDLSEAEAVMELISASSNAALVNSQKQLSGFLKKKIEKLRSVILHESAYIESALDDPEHFDLEGYPKRLFEIITKVKDEIDKLSASFDEGQFIKSGIKAVILGKPNVGKSTFMNALLGRDKAIVTDIAGTTRDVLDEDLSICGIPFVITDTAGIRDTDDVVERIGVSRAKDAASCADLILYIADINEGISKEDEDILSELSDKKVIILLNKADIQAGANDEKASFDIIKNNENYRILAISAKEQTGLENLYDILKDMFFKGKLAGSDEMYITNLRHKECLADASFSIDNVIAGIMNNVSEDLYTIDLMDAYTSLGHIIGAEVSDDLVEEIFSRFCMGK